MAIFQTPDGRFFNIPSEKADEVADKLKDFEMSPEEIEAEINKAQQARAEHPAPTPRVQAGGVTVINIFCGDGPAAVRARQGDVEGYGWGGQVLNEDPDRYDPGQALLDRLESMGLDR